MKYGFNVYQTKVEDHVFWIAESKDLKGCVGQGETADEALAELENNEIEWLESAAKYGIDIPEPTIETLNEYSGKFVVRVSPTVHKEAAEKAKKEGISLNQYANNALVAMNTAKTTADIAMEALKGYQEMFGQSIVKKYGKQNVIPYSVDEGSNLIHINAASVN